MGAASRGSGTVGSVHACDLKFSRRMTPGAVRRRRGAALPITVLVALAAATIATVTLRQAYASIEAAANRQAERQAKALVEGERAAIEAALSADGSVFLSAVWPSEAPRICITAAPGSDEVAGGEAWPASCGWEWEYAPEALADGAVRVQVTLPSSTDTSLRVAIAARVDEMRHGVEYRYVPAGSGRWAVWSASGLDLTGLSGDSVVSGSLYSGEDLDLPGEGGAIVEAGIVVAEGAVNGLSGEDTRRYGANTGGVPEVLPTRRAVPTPELRHHLEAQTERSIRAACATTGSASSETNSLALCLRRGASIPTVGETPINVPTTVAAYLIVPGSTPGTLAIHVAASAPVAERCADPTAPSCNLATLADDEITGGVHPGVGGTWGAALTEVLWPASGVISADADVYLGLCGSGFATSEGTCTTSTFTQPLTVIAGTLGDPRDLYVNGPISGSALQAVATGAVHLPYWARPVGGNLTVEAALVGLDLFETGSAVTAWPTPYPSAAVNQGAVLTLSGGLVGPALDVTSLGFTDVTISRGQSAPWAVAAGNGWQRVEERPLTGADLDDLLS
jgi:hypothetical protein